jgi:hypothetical protein
VVAITAFKPRTMKYTGVYHVHCKPEMKQKYFVWMTRGSPIWRPRRRWKNTIKHDLKRTGFVVENLNDLMGFEVWTTANMREGDDTGSTDL